ncbi:MAG: hypothetical protein GY703_20690 [Gammaproteobacteria bacterium]|nr:hypothetical protein [Gammaproteobacteria bacterium]
MVPTDRRARLERRQSLNPFNFHSIRGRRRERRRQGVTAAAQRTDTYGADLLFVVIMILFFCAADAHNTLLLLSDGASELNPVMDLLIQHDVRVFVYLKLLLTSLGLLALVSCEYQTLWKRFRVNHLLYLILAGYLVLIGYQSALMPLDLPGLVLR